MSATDQEYYDEIVWFRHVDDDSGTGLCEASLNGIKLKLPWKLVEKLLPTTAVGQ